MKRWLVLFLFTPMIAYAEYSVEVYAYRGFLNTARTSHNFARFSGPQGVVDISFVPAKTRGLRLDLMPPFFNHTPINRSVEETLERAAMANRKVTSSGPRPIDPEIYRRAVEYSAILSSGAFPYHGLGLTTNAHFTRPNCVHANTNINGDFKTGLRRADGLIEPIVQHLQKPPVYPVPYYQPPEVQRAGILPAIRERFGRR